MKFRISILAFLFGLFSVGAVAQTTQSDYEIQKSFKQQYAEFEQQIEEVSSSDSAEAVIESIRNFEEKYSEHSDLLDKVLYPASFSETMEDLKTSATRTVERLQEREKRTKKLEELETQVADYEQNLNKLNQRTDSLEQAMQESIQSEKQLSGMVRQYRENLENRDELILAFIDSMIIAYQQMDLEDLQDLEDMDEKSRIKSDGDALQMIHQISVENQNILEKNADRLQLQDYMRMAQVQSQFEDMWTRLGDKIQQVYDGENAEQMAAEIDKNIDQWSQTLQNQTFATFRDSLARNNIEVGGFNNSEEFYSSISNYLDRQIEQSKEESSEAMYERYRNFQDFWNQFGVQWSGSMVDAEILDRNQLATINEKVDIWGQNAQPESTNWLVYLLGASVLLAIALGVLLVRERQNKNQT